MSPQPALLRRPFGAFTVALLAILGLGVPILSAANLYVAPPASGGSDANPGTLAAPFATIQRAANVAVAGDTVFIRAGTYRETVTPANSGTAAARITYRNYNDEVAILNGADPLSSAAWTLDSGNIYRTPLAASFFTSSFNQALQVFVDGSMVTLSKWPNTTTKTNAYPDGTAPAVDILHPAKSTITAFVSKTRNTSTNVTTGVVTDTALPAKPAGFYTGAGIFFQPNNGGWSWTFSGTVTDVPANGNQITFATFNDSGQDGSGNLYRVGSRYYLFDKKEFLDAPGEWWHDRANGQLYLWSPDSATPAARLVEVKKRDYAFNLTNRSYITIQDLVLFACTITTDTAAGGSALGYNASGAIIYPWRGAGTRAASTGVIIDGITASYINHFTDVSGHFFLQWGTASGIVLGGTGHTLRNSTIRSSAGNGVGLQGAEHVVFNNVFTDLSYAGVDTSAINTTGAGAGLDHEIAYNTIRRVGRSGITPRGLANSAASSGQFKARIHHNDVAHFGLQDWDVGGLYTATNDGKFARIDHNLFSEGLGYTASGVYLDYEKNWVVDHNVVWNLEWGLKFQGSNAGVNNTLVYNNTSLVRNTSGVSFGPFAIGNGSGNNNGTVLRNNVLGAHTPPSAPGYQAIGSGSSAFSGAEQANNLAWDGVLGSSTDPRFVNRATTLAATGVDYSLQAGSAALNVGTVISSYTRDGIVVPPFPDAMQGAAPDLGAYEYGQPRWVAGADFTRCAEPIPSPWPGRFGASVTVALRTLTPGATIRYTIDGTTPTATTGIVYTAPFTLSAPATVRSLAVASGLADSPVALHDYDINVPPPLGTPLAFSAVAAAGPVVNLAWTDNASAETGYLVERRAGADVTWSTLATLTANAASHADTSASPNTEYAYRVRAFNAGGSGTASAEALVITPGVFTQPGTLTAAQATNVSVTVPVQIRNVASTAQTFTFPAVTGAYLGATSAQPGGPAFAPWEDISGTGLPIAQLTPTASYNPDDDLSPAINLGFPFPFFGENHTQLKVAANGYLTFDLSPSTSAYGNLALPSASAPFRMIAFLWDDLYFSQSKSSRAYTRSYDSTGGARPDTFIVQFSNVVLYSDQSGPTATVQVILKKDGSIVCKYLELQPNNTGYTIGLNNATGTQGLQLAFNQAYLSPGFALRIASGFGLTASPSSLTVPANSTGAFNLTINSAGLAVGNAAATLQVTSTLARQPAIFLPVSLEVLAANPAAPAVPSGLSGAGTATSASLSWTDVAGETSFRLERAPSGSATWTEVAWLPQGTTAFTDTPPATGSYAYRLRAANAGGNSAASASVSLYVGQPGSVQAFRAAQGLAADGSQDLLTPAGDGVANLLKYAFNLLGSGAGQAASLSTPNAFVLAPGASAGLPFCSLLPAPGSSLQITFIRRKAASSPGVTYAVEWSDTLASWAVNPSASETATSIDGTFERVTVTDSSPLSDSRFVRLRVTTP